jgi:hypothetical protein
LVPHGKEAAPQFAIEYDVWRREHAIERPMRTARLAERREMLA